MLCQRALLLDEETGSFPLQRTLEISPAKTNEALKSKPCLHKVGDGISYIWKSKIRVQTVAVPEHRQIWSLSFCMTGAHIGLSKIHLLYLHYIRRKENLICAAVWIIISSFWINLSTVLQWAFELFFQKIWEGLGKCEVFYPETTQSIFEKVSSYGGCVCVCVRTRMRTELLTDFQDINARYF